MNKRYVILSVLISLVMMFPTIAAVSAMDPASRVAGVQVGQWFQYSISFANNITGVSGPSPDLIKGNGTVASISGTNVTFSMQMQYKNGTTSSDLAWIDVNSGNCSSNIGVPIVIAANLGAGDLVYTGESFSFGPNLDRGATINGTVSRTFLGSTRPANYFNATAQGASGSISYYSSTSGYWDQATGVMSSYNVLVQEHNSTSNSIAELTLAMQLVSGKLTAVPEFQPLTFMIAASALTACAAAIAYRRKSSPTKTPSTPRP